MTFLEKYQLLKKSIPVPAYIGSHSVDCDYVDYCYSSKNCHYSIGCFLQVDGLYSYYCWGNKLVDCTYVQVKSEKCYESVDSTKCHSCTYIFDSNNSTDCHFSAYLNKCTDCFGCVALTHKKYCIFNKQYSKEEYVKRVRELKKENPEILLKRMFELKKSIPHPASQQFNTENCLYGNYIYDSKNCYWAFNSYECENSGYFSMSGLMKNSWELFYCGGDWNKKIFSERCYECIDSDANYECAYLNNSEYNTNCNYSADLRNCTDCFGCVGLSKKKYCILNNQLTKEQYEKSVKEIKKELGWKI